MESYAYTPLYYDNPTRVRYYDTDFRSWVIGICIEDKLITTDGQLVNISYIVEKAVEDCVHWDSAIIEMSWEKLS